MELRSQAPGASEGKRTPGEGGKNLEKPDQEKQANSEVGPIIAQRHSTTRMPEQSQHRPIPNLLVPQESSIRHSGILYGMRL